MRYPNLFKRIVPFALALMLGLFVASFFVSLSPSFRAGRGRMMKQWRAENWDLKLENERLKEENAELKRTYPDCKSDNYKNLDLYKEWEVPPAPRLEKRLREKLERLEKVK